jgi:CubicO group peptidase (beta-lactamase class C family)
MHILPILALSAFALQPPEPVWNSAPPDHVKLQQPPVQEPPVKDSPTKPAPNMPAIDKAKLEKRIDELAAEAVEKEGVPGMSIAVAQDGEILVAKGYGYADAAHAQPARADTRYSIGSLTRQFTAVAIPQLVDEKKLSLDDDVGKLLPGFPAGKRKITLRHLLAQSSGIPGLSKLVAKHPELIVKRMSEDAFFKVFADVPFDFEPGAAVATDSADYVLLSMILAKTSGMSHADYVSKNILKEIGLKQTTFCPLKDEPVGFAKGCKAIAEPGELEIPLAAAPDYSTQSLCSTVTDLVQWEKALSDRVLLGEASSRLLFGEIGEAGDDTSKKAEGHGFAMQTRTLDDFQTREHFGGVGGFRVCLVHYPLPRITVVILANCEAAPVERIERDIARFVLGLPAPASADLAVPPEDLVRCAGLYQIATTQVRVEAKDDKLWYTPAGGARVKLLHRGNLVFAFENDKDAVLTFEIQDGKCTGFTVQRDGLSTTAKKME